MVIRQEILANIKNNVALKAKLCAVFNKHFGTVERWINMNIDNGPLTTASALEAIRQETGLPEEEILDKKAVATTL